MAFYFYWGLFSQFFAHTKLGDWREFTFFLNFNLKGVVEKCIGCFLVDHFLGGFIKKM